MTLKCSLVLAMAVVLSGSIAQAIVGDVRRERSEQRPTVTEVGEPYSIDVTALRRQAQKISDLRDFIIRNGYPDYVEIQEVAPEWPWESYEVRLYYLQWNLEVDFGHVLFSDAIADLGVTKFEGEISPEKLHEIEVILAARQLPPQPAVVESLPTVEPRPLAAEEPSESPQASRSTVETIVARLEAAAERASRAADAAVEQSEAAVRAANRTVDIVRELEEGAAAAHTPSP